MTAFNQDFEMYQGDDQRPIFAVKDGAGAAINLSTASEIQWLLHDPAGVVKLTKLKTTAGVVFVTTGTDGKIYIDILASESALLDGWYAHSARLTDAGGKLSVFEMGRMLVKVRSRGE